MASTGAVMTTAPDMEGKSGEKAPARKREKARTTGPQARAQAELPERICVAHPLLPERRGKCGGKKRRLRRATPGRTNDAADAPRGGATAGRSLNDTEEKCRTGAAWATLRDQGGSAAPAALAERSRAPGKRP